MPVRDHYPRWLMCMYYPTDTTLEMGPTCISPGSQYFEVDRLEWGTLGTGIDPPVSESDPHAAEWHEAVARDGRVMNGKQGAKPVKKK